MPRHARSSDIRRLVVTLAIVAGFGALIAGTRVSAADGALPDIVDAARDERAKYGFSTDADRIRGLIASGGHSYSGQFGFPISQDEAEDLDRRAAFADRLAAEALPFIRSLDEYGGQWIDQRNGGRLVVGVTRGRDTLEQAIRSRMPDKTEGLEVVEVNDSFQALEKAFDRAWDVWSNKSPRSDLTSVSLDAEHNRITFEVLEPGRVGDEVKREVESELGVDIRVAQGHVGRDVDCPTRSKCFDPLRAGSRIYNAFANNSSWHCTMAFHISNSSQNNELDHTFMTAGHCAYEPVRVAVPNDWHQDAAYGHIGNEKANAILSNDRDVMLVKIADWPSQKSRIVLGEGQGHPMGQADWPIQGEYLCMSLGRSAEVRCGTVGDTSRTWESDNVQRLMQGAAIDYANSIPDLIKGDSGSPIYRRVWPCCSGPMEIVPIGIVDHERNPSGVAGGHDVYFAKARWATNHWGLTIYNGAT